MDYLVDYKNGHNCSEDFGEKFHSFGILKKLTYFFESANFLMTKYHLLDDRINAIFENNQGDTLQFRNFLCDYGGRGLNNMARVLTRLGIAKELAETCCCSEEHNGFQIDFESADTPNKYRVVQISYKNWFSSFKDGVSYSIVKQTMVFCLSHKETLSSLFRCLQLMEPFSFEYSLDAALPIQTEEDLVEANLIPRSLYDSREKRDANLFIRGERFSVYCCIPPNALRGTLNAVYFSLSGENLFRETHIGALSFLNANDDHVVTRLEALKLLLSSTPRGKREFLLLEKAKEEDCKL